MKTSTVLKILGALCVLLLLWQLFIHLIGVFVLAILMIGLVTAVLFAVKISLNIMQRSGAAASQSPPTAIAAGRRVWESNGSAVLFLKEPSFNELITLTNSSSKTTEHDSGAVIRVSNNTKVMLLEEVPNDTRKDTVKVKVNEGPLQGKVGWMDRGALIKDN